MVGKITLRAHTSSPVYARQNGKPVVCVRGFGFNDPGRPSARWPRRTGWC